MVVIFTSILTMVFLFLALAVDAVLGVNLGQRLLAIETIEAQQIPLVLWVLVSLATFLGILLATLIAGRFIDKRRWGDFGLQFSKEWWVDFAFGLVLGAFLIGLIFLFGWATGNVRITGFFQPIGESINFLTGFLQSLIFFIFVGLYEELLTRGYHLVNLSEGLNWGFLGKRRAIYLAVFITSLAFGSFHVFNPNASWVSTVNIALVGLIFSLGMIFTQRLAIPIGLHIAWNFFQGNVFGFPVSGMRNGATLIATETLGPDWLMGGFFGPEAGLVGVGAMLLGGALILLWIRRRGVLALQSDLAIYSPMEHQKKV
jgi:membrane protease YdiL (CAAX protease family)